MKHERDGENRLDKKLADETIEEVKRLVQLLQIHQIELEHQNEELRQTQRELEESRNKYFNLFDFSPIPYFTLNRHGVIKEVNLSAGNMLGLKRNRLIEKPLGRFIKNTDKDIFDYFLNSVFGETEKQSCKLQIVNMKDEHFDVDIEGIKLDNPLDEDEICLAAVIDYTEIKKAQESLIKSNRELEKLNAANDRFLSIIAHDLRSPFQSLLNNSELLAEEFNKLSPERISSISKGFNKNLWYLFDLIENMLNWSLMQEGIIKFEPETINLYEEINNAIDLLSSNAQNKSISITNNVDNEISVFADSGMLRSIIQNLITNAVKYSNYRGKIIITAVKNEKTVEVSIEDNGVGIKEENLVKLFNFNSLYSTEGTDREKGTGLGLTLCKEFIEKNGGKIWVESELGKGTKFTFTIPCL